MKMDNINEYNTNHFGTQLKTARELLNLSQKEVAARLHLSVNIIQILESDSMSHSLPITFTRGYMRSYARLLNFSEQEINQALQQLGLTSSSTTLMPMLTTIGTSKDYSMRWLTYLIIFLLLTLVSIWWSTHPRYTFREHSQHIIAIHKSASAINVIKQSIEPNSDIAINATKLAVALPTPGIN